MKNYLSIAQKWADVKRQILVEHERVAPMIVELTEQFSELSGQSISSEHTDTPCKLKFYPSWGGFCYTYSSAWHSAPDVHRNWEWTLKEAQEVLTFLKSMNEEEVKILFREWSEKWC